MCWTTRSAAVRGHGRKQDHSDALSTYRTSLKKGNNFADLVFTPLVSDRFVAGSPQIDCQNGEPLRIFNHVKMQIKMPTCW